MSICRRTIDMHDVGPLTPRHDRALDLDQAVEAILDFDQHRRQLGDLSSLELIDHGQSQARAASPTRSGECITTRSDLAAILRVGPRCPGWPPDFFPLG